MFNELIELENSSILPKEKKQNQIDGIIANSLQFLVQELSKITEFSMRDLVPLSMLQKHKYIAPHLDYLILNKKHIKRKHSKEILQAIEKISAMIHIGNYPEYEQNRRFTRE